MFHPKTTAAFYQKFVEMQCRRVGRCVTIQPQSRRDTTVKHIIAIGGGGLSVAPDGLLLERYILAQSGKARPAVCFLPNASADPGGYSLSFYAALSQLDCRLSHLSLFAPPSADLASFLLEKDVIYVGGGNTKSMLALWREW